MSRAEDLADNSVYVQEVVQAYMEDDIVYKVIDFTHKNLYSLLTIAILSLLAYIIGRTTGTRASSLVKNMKEKYENIEHKKKAARALIVLLTKVETLLMTIIYVFLLGELCLLANIIYVNGFQYHFFFRNSLTRTIMFSLFVSMVLILVARRIVKRIKISKVLHLRSIDQGVNEIGKELIEKLGPELVAIIKVQLFGAQIKPTRNTGSQTLEIPQTETVRRHSESISKEKIQEMLMKQATKYEVEKGILVKDLERHKAFMHVVTSFEWCDYCCSLAAEDLTTNTPALSNKTSHIEEKEAEEQGEKGKVEEERDDTLKVGENNFNYESPFVKKRISRRPSLQETVPTACTNDCLKKYFQMGYLIGERFQKEEEEMKKLKDEYKKLTQIISN